MERKSQQTLISIQTEIKKVAKVVVEEKDEADGGINWREWETPLQEKQGGRNQQVIMNMLGLVTMQSYNHS